VVLGIAAHKLNEVERARLEATQGVEQMAQQNDELRREMEEPLYERRRPEARTEDQSQATTFAIVTDDDQRARNSNVFTASRLHSLFTEDDFFEQNQCTGFNRVNGSDEVELHFRGSDGRETILRGHPAAFRAAGLTLDGKNDQQIVEAINHDIAGIRQTNQPERPDPEPTIGLWKEVDGQDGRQDEVTVSVGDVATQGMARALIEETPDDIEVKAVEPTEGSTNQPPHIEVRVKKGPETIVACGTIEDLTKAGFGGYLENEEEQPISGSHITRLISGANDYDEACVRSLVAGAEEARSEHADHSHAPIENFPAFAVQSNTEERDNVVAPNGA
jgi:hypothetical protein